MNLDFIVRTIQKGKCVLFLGPEAARTESGINGKPLHLALLDFIEHKNNPNISAFYDNDDMFLFPNGMARTRTCYQIDEFYTKDYQNGIYEKLSQIPFPLIVSTSPDLFLKNAYEKHKLPYVFDFYSFTSNPKEVQRPTVDIPLIYNLFGTHQKDDSLILSHKDLYNFLFAILGDYKLPKELKNCINNANNLIFIGFQFDKWYMQILMRLFNLLEESFDRYAANNQLKDDIKDFYNKQFNISFIDNHIDEFINNLHIKCNELGVLKSIAAGEITVEKQVISLIETDQVEKALQILKNHLEKLAEPELSDDVTLLLGRYSRLQRKIERGIIEKEEEDVESNKIKDAVLGITKELKP